MSGSPTAASPPAGSTSPNSRFGWPRETVELTTEIAPGMQSLLAP
jgi:hypothetical protein